MTAVFSQDFNQLLGKKIPKACKACGLHLNQAPLYQAPPKSTDIFWVGLSAVRLDPDRIQLPLAPDTNSGALIEQIEIPLRKQLQFYKTNIVKCLPLKENQKIRYPKNCEINNCFVNFEDELKRLKPKIVFLLGKQVAQFVIKKFTKDKVVFDKDFKYDVFEINNIYFVPVHHPSYILVYKRKYIDQYARSLRNICKEYLE